MSVKIRLRRVGARKRPFYRLVVADARSPRDGRFIEAVGTYDPLQDPALVRIDGDRVKHWISQGARPTDIARELLVREGVLERSGPVYEKKEKAPRPSKKQVAKAAAAEAAAAAPPEAATPESEAPAEPAAQAEATAPAEAEAAPEPAAAEATPEPEPEAEAAPQPAAEAAPEPEAVAETQASEGGEEAR